MLQHPDASDSGLLLRSSVVCVILQGGVPASDCGGRVSNSRMRYYTDQRSSVAASSTWHAGSPQ